MSFEKQCCYRGLCTSRCADPGNADAQVHRLRAQLGRLRQAEAQKMNLLAQISQLEGQYMLRLKERESVITEYSTKLDIDNDILNKLSQEIDFLKNKLADMQAALAALLKEIQGLEKSVAFKEAELKKLIAEAKQNDAANESIYHENRDIETRVSSVREELQTHGKEEEHQSRALTENLNILRSLDRQLLDAESNLCKVQKQVKLLEEERDRIKEMLRRSNKAAEIARLQRLLSELSLKIDDSRARIATLEQMCEETSGDLRAKKYETDMEKSRFQELQHQNFQLEDAIREKERLLLQRAGGLAEKKRRLEELRARYKSLECEYEVSNSVINDSEKVNVDLRNELQYLIKADEDVRSQIERKLASGRGAIENISRIVGYTSNTRLI